MTGDSTDLVAFLTARLDETKVAAQAAAEAAGGSTWMREPAAINDPVHIHIDKHDPWRVLADVAAKRAIIDHCQGTIGAAGDPPGIDPADVPAIAHVLRLLAQQFSAHPDFQDAWRFNVSPPADRVHQA